MTGWSRYTHHRNLCELLPAGIPTLALCAAMMHNGGLDQSLQLRVSRELGFKDVMSLGNDPDPSVDLSSLSFPGSDVYKLVEKRQQVRMKKKEMEAMGELQRLEGARQ